MAQLQPHFSQMCSPPHGCPTAPGELSARIRSLGDSVGFAAEPRFGNFLRDSIGQRAMTIYLHNYWSTPDWQGYTYPADGYIDALMATFDSTKWRGI